MEKLIRISNKNSIKTIKSSAVNLFEGFEVLLSSIFICVRLLGHH